MNQVLPVGCDLLFCKRTLNIPSEHFGPSGEKLSESLIQNVVIVISKYFQSIWGCVEYSSCLSNQAISSYIVYPSTPLLTTKPLNKALHHDYTHTTQPTHSSNKKGHNYKIYSQILNVSTKIGM